MLDDKICSMREKLNKSIAMGEDYESIYKTSIELDELITQYYVKHRNFRASNINNEKTKEMFTLIN